MRAVQALPLSDAVRQACRPLDLDPLVERIGDARLVLLGEASHGTHEYYLWRSRLSKRLITEKGFDFISVEGDWPDCYEVNRYVKGYPGVPTEAAEMLRAFNRWPTWMWANWEMAALAEWMKTRNLQLDESDRAGFYGLDVYSLWQSMDAVFEHLRESHPELLGSAERVFDCFSPYERDEQSYAWSAAHGLANCEAEIIEMLLDLQRGPEPEDAESHFNAEQNAHAALGAERYYRTMIRGDGKSWNIRDEHMMDTFDRLLERHGPDSKAIVWAHNTHIGDARQTDMRQAGMFNIGQLARERHAGDGVVLVGFGSYAGSVIAGRKWGAPMERMDVPEARRASWEALLHEHLSKDSLVLVDHLREVEEAEEIRGHRAIGVVYNPEHERLGNYVPTNLPRRYDAFVFLDRTHSLHPLHPPVLEGPPETYPWGF